MSRKRISIHSRLIQLISSKEFIALTILGNTVIIVFSTVVFHLETDVNPLMTEYLDAVWWAFATVTTVGYGDIVPMTYFGKIIGIFLMLLGTGIFATYTALFANALLGRDIGRLKGEVRHIRSGMRNIEQDEENLELSIEEIRNTLNRLEKQFKKDKQKKEN
ncbi:potassium channel family protein [Halobacteriovorax sp. HLS]|uniref:potassium channel family protein n=1 Tax=Halobacteriovorax sp. HLS TaxID=2234000 RepID=UPI0013E3A6BF|nr:potassium channel family protein [Halobacteriovorax sp. HLS]